MSKKERHLFKMVNKPIKDRRLRTIWNGNGPMSNSGYSVELRDVLLRLAADGWPVAWICSPGLEVGSPVPFNNIMLYPHGMDAYGSDIIIPHSNHFKADAVFTMQDLGTLDPNMLRILAGMKKPWIPYFPVDQEPVPPHVISQLQNAYKLITFSNFGYKAIQKNGFSSTLILEGTDCNIFQPRDKVEARKLLNWPQDKFIFAMIGANKENPPRKGWPQGLDAFKKFSDSHPDSLLYVHSNQWLPTGFPILEYAKHLGIADKIVTADQYMVTFHSDSTTIAKIMNGIDCLLEPSMTEGFCLPVIEAQASGTPVIANNCHSMPELIVDGVTSEICETKGTMFSSQQGYIYFADVDDLYNEMEKVFKNGKDFYTKAAREHILANYNIDTIVQEKWIPYLESLQQELLGPLPPTLQKLQEPVKLDQSNTQP